MKNIAVLLVTLIFASTAQAALFDDVPKTHWAYEAIAEAVEAGILQGYDNKFNGNRQLNRYQMAVITAKMLDCFKNKEAAPSDFDLSKLEALTIEFSDEIAQLKNRVDAIDEWALKAKDSADAQPVQARDIGFSAFASFALVANQDDAGGNRYSSRNIDLDSTFFDMQQGESWCGPKRFLSLSIFMLNSTLPVS